MSEIKITTQIVFWEGFDAAIALAINTILFFDYNNMAKQLIREIEEEVKNYKKDN